MLFRVFLPGSSIHLFIYSFIYLLPTQEAFVLTDACSGVAAKAQTDFLGIRATAHSKHSGLGKHTRRKSDLWAISCSGRWDFCPYWTKGRLEQGWVHLSTQGRSWEVSDFNKQSIGEYRRGLLTISKSTVLKIKEVSNYPDTAKWTQWSSLRNNKTQPM